MTMSASAVTTTETLQQQHQNYVRVAEVIAYLHQYQQSQPNLAELAKHAGLSESHLQRIFTAWAGISPKAFLQFLTKEYAKAQLQNQSVMDTAHNLGLSGPSRLYDLFVQWEGMTPGEYKTQGKGLLIEYGFHPSPFGNLLLATSERGICTLAFFDHETEKQKVMKDFQADWREASLVENPLKTQELGDAIFAQVIAPSNQAKPLKLLLKGTPFQQKVWEALLRIPFGQLTDYGQLATHIHQPNASRAVASAIARNKIGLLIPCHRVIRNTGLFSQYRWGADRKQALIGWEAAHLNSQ